MRVGNVHIEMQVC